MVEFVAAAAAGAQALFSYNLEKGGPKDHFAK
jgi:hypothetical protein